MYANRYQTGCLLPCGACRLTPVDIRAQTWHESNTPPSLLSIKHSFVSLSIVPLHYPQFSHFHLASSEPSTLPMSSSYLFFFFTFFFIPVSAVFRGGGSTIIFQCPCGIVWRTAGVIFENLSFFLSFFVKRQLSVDSTTGIGRMLYRKIWERW